MANWLQKIFKRAAKTQTSESLSPASVAAPAHNDIWAAIEAGDAAAVTAFATENPQVLNTTKLCGIAKKNFIELKPVHLAAFLGKAEVLKALHLQGADLNDMAPKNLNPLILAARCREKTGDGSNCARYILDNSKVDIDAVSDSGMAALVEAARWTNEKTVALLLARGARTDITPPSGAPALVAAGEQPSAAILRDLLDHGADIDATDGHGRTALWWALQRNNPEAAGLLIDRNANILQTDKDGVTPLMSAAYHRNVAGAARLIAGGAEVQTADNSGNTALHWTAFSDVGRDQEQGLRDGKAMVDLLLAHGAFVDAPNSRGETPQLSAGPKRTSMTRYLEEKCKDPACAKIPPLEHAFRAGTDKPVTIMKKIQLRLGFALA